MIIAPTSHLFIIIFENMGEIYPLLDFLEVVILLVALMLVDLLAYQLPLRLSYYWSLFTSYIPITVFAALLP